MDDRFKKAIETSGALNARHSQRKSVVQKSKERVERFVEVTQVPTTKEALSILNERVLHYGTGKDTEVAGALNDMMNEATINESSAVFKPMHIKGMARGISAPPQKIVQKEYHIKVKQPSAQKDSDVYGVRVWKRGGSMSGPDNFFSGTAQECADWLNKRLSKVESVDTSKWGSKAKKLSSGTVRFLNKTFTYEEWKTGPSTSMFSLREPSGRGSQLYKEGGEWKWSLHQGGKTSVRKVEPKFQKKESVNESQDVWDKLRQECNAIIAEEEKGECRGCGKKG